jgi:hypothetical protein
MNHSFRLRRHGAARVRLRAELSSGVRRATGMTAAVTGRVRGHDRYATVKSSHMPSMSLSDIGPMLANGAMSVI